ncbi:Retrotransposon gag protein-domain-containing protein [Fimicolochytrium jonesii]|uniref:Retrotransposon gag protein-domain-containing protein n=1 Tax=Fimicolochytrium jonesii TaxID=1396493 RepID=UPI0022FE2C75|nr:Retrotransposon gag protein-domain-containing protein [Fimicolochytrium jonesii]KAI8819533.1 Retrotransposon gag protein-domain-containing protein [Fimicolochytrium jonesii]
MTKRTKMTKTKAQQQAESENPSSADDTRPVHNDDEPPASPVSARADNRDDDEDNRDNDEEESPDDHYAGQGSHALTHTDELDQQQDEQGDEDSGDDEELSPQGLLQLMAKMESSFAEVVNETREQAAADKAELLARQASLHRLLKESHDNTKRLERLLTQQIQQTQQQPTPRSPFTFSNVRPVNRTLASPAQSHLPSPVTPPELQERSDTTNFVAEGPIAKSLREGLATFDGMSRSTKSANEFLTRLDRYFAATPAVPDIMKISLAASKLKDTAERWYEQEESTILTWEAFKDRLRNRFIPPNAEEHALLALERLTQTGSVDEYYQRFSALLLEIPEMTDKQACRAFRKGLRPGIQRLLAANPSSLTMSLAELVTLADSVYSVDSARRDEANKRPPAKQWPPSNKRAAIDVVGTGPATKRLKKLTNDERQRLRDQGACFRCRQPGHMQSDCPKYPKARVHAITTEPQDEDPQPTQGDFQ